MKSRNTYSRGINQDVSKLKFPQDAYFTAQNFRPVTRGGESTGALENIVGNTGSFSLFGTAGNSDTIIGSTNIRDTTVLFSTACTGANPGGVDPDVAADAASTGRIWTVDTTASIPNDTLTLIANKTFNFTSKKPIFAVGRYENEDVQKVYWVDDLNNMRFVNIADAGVAAQPVDQFDIVADIMFEKPVLSSIGSGGLDVGSVQYAYQLFNTNGAETTYSPASNLVHLARSGEQLPNSGMYYGSPQLDSTGDQNNSGKSVTMSISNIDTSFDQIRVVAIHYNQLNTTPAINVVAIRPVESSIVFTDDGVYDLGGISLSAYRLLSPRVFTARTLETKDHILFPANITDRFWDVTYDARAYRFNDSRDSRIYNANGVTLEKLIAGAAPAYPSVVTGASLDAFNIMNDITNDDGRSAADTYIYQPDGTRIGGSGPNVGYTFKVNPVRIDDSIATGTYSLSIANTDALGLSFEDYASPYTSGTLRGYHRSEIYRFGIVLYDAKGRVSPVKWIGDIRMPDASNEDSVTTYNDGGDQTDFLTAYLHADGRTRAGILGIDFTVNNLPTGAVSYQIVRVRRESNDRTVLAQGPIFQPAWNGTDSVYMPVSVQLPPAQSDVTPSLSLIYSPEVSVNKNLAVGGSDYIEMVSSAATGDVERWTTAGYSKINPADGVIVKLRGYDVLAAAEYADRSFDVTDGMIIPVGPSGTTYNINSTTYTNYNYPSLDAYGGTVLVINQADAAWNPVAASGKFVVNYRRPVLGYGGVSYEDRGVNEYIACSDVSPAATNAITVYGGDTFIGFFDFQNIIWNKDKAPPSGSYWSARYTPLESSINCNLRNDDSFHRVYNVENSYLIQEEAGAHTNVTDSYTQDTDLYAYNSAYSQENISKQYLPISSNFSAQTKSDALVISSGVKANGELIDSWTQFREADEIEVDTRYGPISKLLNFRNHLVFFQDNGIGTVGINQQSLLTTTGNLPELSLGKGGVLDRYDYITIDSGCKQQEAVCGSEGGFYWYDASKNKFYRYSGQLKNISDVEGLFSYFNTRVKKSNDGRSDLFLGNQIISVFDDKYREATYSFKDIQMGTVDGKGTGTPNYIRVSFRDGDVDGFADGDTVIVDGVTITNTVIQHLSDGPVIRINSNQLYADYTTGDDVRIHFPNTTGNFTVVYNELIDAFVYFPSYAPESFIKTFQTYLSVDSSKYVYEHNRGQRGTFYDVTSPSTVQILVNPNADVVNVYNNIELMTEVYDKTGSNVVDETVSSVRVTNDYQDSGVISLVPGTNIKRRLRKWRLVVPREGVARIRDAHANMLFSYTNDGVKRIVFHDVITHFIPREF